MDLSRRSGSHCWDGAAKGSPHSPPTSDGSCRGLVTHENEGDSASSDSMVQATASPFLRRARRRMDPCFAVSGSLRKGDAEVHARSAACTLPSRLMALLQRLLAAVLYRLEPDDLGGFGTTLTITEWRTRRARRRRVRVEVPDVPFKGAPGTSGTSAGMQSCTSACRPWRQSRRCRFAAWSRG